MVTINIKGGTPRGSDTLCRTCSYAHIIRGFAESEVDIYCRYFYFERQIQFAVSDCTWYEDKRLPCKRDMEEIAWILTTKKPGRTIGFVSAADYKEILRQNEEEILPAADAGDSTE